MTVLIKGMEMPATRYDCPFYDFEGVCFANYDGVACNTNGPLPHNCPLVEVPEPHGDLIDRDKMLADLATVDPQYETMTERCGQVANAQPTVIEAEGPSEEEMVEDIPMEYFESGGK